VKILEPMSRTIFHMWASMHSGGIRYLPNSAQTGIWLPDKSR
jgi:hypothetical protein